MAGFSFSRRVAAPIHTVFDVFTDLEKATERIKGISKIELLTPTPIGIGTRWKETRKQFGKTAEVLAITEFIPNQSYRVGCESHGAAFTTDFRFEQVDGLIEVHVVFDCQAKTFLAKLLSPLSAMMMNTVKKCIEQDVDDLKAVAESLAKT